MSVEPTSGGSRIPPPLLLKFAIAAALSLGVVALLPRMVSGSGAVPPARTLFETAVLVGLICATGLFWGMRSDLRLPLKVAVYAVAFNVLVIFVKLWLAPKGFYDVNQIRDLTSGFDMVVLVLVGFGSGGAILILLLPVFGGLDYLDFVFSSSVSLLVALALAAATALAALTLDATARRAHVLGDATLYMSVFWVGLYFLALYHVLWVVYVLVLTSIWPLKVVTPK
ncbi:MAG: hypothetical protein JF623_01785 [Acidobacteria bacterium]|nr:hypothetical protein [Acidobacteriota bacterium]